jgi:hypothetical protein
VATTLGAFTSDRAQFTSGITLGATARTCLVAGWYYPTTLTATRRLFSAGAIWGAEIDTTTDELRLRTDNTTDGQWTTTGVDLATDTWKFIAIMNSTFNTGPAGAWRVWVGTADTAPVEATVTVATSPTGNFTGNATVYIGNTSATATSWQGDIEEFRVVATSATIGVSTHPFSQATYGTITNAEAQIALERFVLPFWLGRDAQMAGGWAASTVIYYVPLLDFAASTGFGRVRDYGSATTTATAVTGNNAVSSQNGGPVRAATLTQVGSPQPVRR